jgi:lipoprotein-releasing system permease protein
MICADGIVVGFQSEIKYKISGFAGHIQVGRLTSNLAYENEPIQINDSFEKFVSTSPEVSYFNRYATKPGIIKTDTDIEGVILKGVDATYHWDFFQQHLKGGRVPNYKSTDSMPSVEAMISTNLAKKLSINLGDKITLYFVQNPPKVRQFEVVGLYETSIEDVDKLFIVCDLAQIYRLNQWKDKSIGGYEIFVKDFNKIETYNEKVREAVRLEEDSRTVKERYPQIFDWLALLNDNIKIILLLMGVVAAINMITALLIMIFERTQMIGLLKALGATNKSVRRIFIYNSMMMIGIGIFIGNTLGIGLLYFQQQYKFLTLAQESYYVSFVPVSFDWTHIIAINVGAFVFCSLAMIIPSFIVLRISPSKALRFE